MKTRSPVLGYNHNIRYARRLWHVQTEDSGVQNPHIFTHLFHDGTILSTKKLDYDPSVDPSTVQKLMQAQHKAMLRELKAGVFDPKIEQFFGTPIVKDREELLSDLGSDADDLTPLSSNEVERLAGRPIRPTPPRAAPPAAPPPAFIEQTRIRPPVPPAVPPSANRHPARPSLTPSRPAVTVTGRPEAPSARPVVGGVGAAARAAQQLGRKPTAEGVVVARPTVIVGGEPPRASQPTAASQFWQTQKSPPNPVDPAPAVQESLFGGELTSEKSLDEVILAYLSEDVKEK